MSKGSTQRLHDKKKYDSEFGRIFRKDIFCDNCKPRIGGIIMTDDLIHCGECGGKIESYLRPRKAGENSLYRHVKRMKLGFPLDK